MLTLLNEQVENKNISINHKKIKYNKSTNQQDFFELLLKNFITNEQNSNQNNSLLKKLLKITKNNQIESKNIDNLLKNFIEEKYQTKKSTSSQTEFDFLIKILFSLENQKSFNTATTKNYSLESLINNQTAIPKSKKLKNIKEIFNIAKKYNIEITKFHFSKEKIDSKVKTNIQNKVTSENILKLIDQDTYQNNKIYNNQKENSTQKTKNKISVLQTILNIEKSIKNKSSNPKESKNIQQNNIDNTNNNKEKTIHINQNKNLSNKNETKIKHNISNQQIIETINKKLTNINNKEFIEKKQKNIESQSQTIIQTTVIKKEKQINEKSNIKQISTQISTITESTKIATNQNEINNLDTKEVKIIKKENITPSKNNKIELEKQQIKLDQTLNSINNKEKEKIVSIKQNMQNIHPESNNQTNFQNSNHQIIQKEQSNLNEIKTSTKYENTEIKEIKNDITNDKSTTINTDTKSQQISNKKTLHDIKQTFNTFALEFKEKVESYKPPLMKIQMVLTPKNLGEVEVTLLNRGNNLHVNISSNPTTIALFAQNQVDFKASLINLGFSNLQMNFNQNSQQQNNSREQHQKNSNSNKISNESENENYIDSFDFIIPKYI